MVPLAAEPEQPLGSMLLARDQPWSDGERHLMRNWRTVMPPLGPSFGTADVSCGGRPGVAAASSRSSPPSSFSECSGYRFHCRRWRRLMSCRSSQTSCARHWKGWSIISGAAERAGQARPGADDWIGALSKTLEVARQALAVAEAEYRQAAQAGGVRGQEPQPTRRCSGPMDQRRADVNYAQSLLERIQVTASSADRHLRRSQRLDRPAGHDRRTAARDRRSQAGRD